MTHDDQVIWQLNRLYMIEGKGINWVWSVGFESGPGFAKCFTVTGLVVLACVEIMDAFALCLLTIDVDIFLSDWFFCEKTGAFLATSIHLSEDTRGAVGVITQT